MKVTGYINGFSAGELGPDVWERADLQQHAKGMAPGENLLVLTTGPAVSRGGFWDRGAAKFQDKAGRLVPFVRSNDDALMLEFYDQGFRVWTPEGDPVLDGVTSNPVNVATPWTAAQLAGLWFKQIGDVFKVTHQDGLVPYHIERLADDDWRVAAEDLRDGPWLPENADAAFTVAVSGIKGTGLTITATKDLFTDAHVGAMFRLRAQSTGAGVLGWSAELEINADYCLCVSDGKIYRTNAATDGRMTGTNPPVHETGTQSDGFMVWTYLHDGAGIVKITAVADARTATCDVVGDWLPTQGVEIVASHNQHLRKLAPSDEGIAFPATQYWAEQAFSTARGWPKAAVEEREERLVYGDTDYRPAMLHMTRTAAWQPDYSEFKPNLGTGRVRPDDAVRMSIGKAGAPIHWFASTTYLVAGGSDAEYLITGANIDDPIKPDSNKAVEASRFGVAPVAPVIAHGPPVTILFVTRTGKTLRELRVAPDASSEGEDATILASHVADRGFAELAWQAPDEICWARLSDGGLAAFTFHQQQQVAAWTTMSLPGGFTVESLCTVPSTTLGGDVLWALVTRTKDGVAQRRLWRLARRAEGMFIDAAQAYVGTPVSAVAGLDAYEGETVTIWADGARQPEVVVTGGEATLKTASGDVIVGLPLVRSFVSLPLDLQGVGSTIGKALTVKHATVTLNCVEADVGDGRDQGTYRIRRRPPTALTAPPLKRIKKRVGLGDGVRQDASDDGRDVRVHVTTDAPFDLEIFSIGLEAEVQS